MTPLEATAFALGIHEDTGLADVPDRDAARRRRARLVPPPRRRGRSWSIVPPHAARRRRALAAECLIDAAEPHTTGGIEMLVSAVSWPGYVDGVSNLAHKIIDLTDCRALVAPRRDGRAGVRGRAQPHGRARCRAFSPRALGGRRASPASSAIFRGTLAEARDARARGAARRHPRSAPRPRRHVRPAAPCRPARPSRRRWSPASATAQAASWSRTDDRLVGSVSREDLDKAVGHGLSHAPVKGIMCERVADGRRG